MGGRRRDAADNSLNANDPTDLLNQINFSEEIAPVTWDRSRRWRGHSPMQA